jgi:Protein of unknown function (DUF3347)
MMSDKQLAHMRIKATTALAVAAVVLLSVTAGRAADNPALTAPVKSVYGSYLKIQVELAKDSIKSVAAEAEAIAKAVDGDSAKMLPAEVANEARTLALAKDLKAARAAFKPLSNSLIKYLADHHVPKGTYVEVFCPMANASWLQADKSVKNPYLGKEMLTCGEIKE